MALTARQWLASSFEKCRRCQRRISSARTPPPTMIAEGPFKDWNNPANEVFNPSH